METVTPKRVSIGLWKTSRKDFAVSHKQGLSKDQIEVLQSLKVGDRLKLWVNEASPIANGPDFNLAVLTEGVPNGRE